MQNILSIKFACKKFYRLVYGQEVISVYQPLILIMHKEFNKTPNNKIQEIKVNFIIYMLR